MSIEIISARYDDLPTIWVTIHSLSGDFPDSPGFIFTGYDSVEDFNRYEYVYGLPALEGGPDYTELPLNYLNDGNYQLDSMDGFGSVKFSVVDGVVEWTDAVVPALWAGAYLTDDGGAHIDLWSSKGWADSSWSLNLANSDVPSYDYLGIFPSWSKSGNGEIDGNYLHIDIGLVKQGNFKLSFQYGFKYFDLDQTDVSPNAELFSFEQLSIPGIETIPKGFIWMGSETKSYKGRLRAQLLVGNDVHAVLMGNALDTILDYADGEQWAMPAILFSEIFWLEPPLEPTSYTLVMEPYLRSGGGGTPQTFPVSMDTEHIYSPGPSAVYDMTKVDGMTISMGLGEARL